MGGADSFISSVSCRDGIVICHYDKNGSTLMSKRRYATRRCQTGWVIVNARTRAVRKLIWITAFKYRVDAETVARWL